MRYLLILLIFLFACSEDEMATTITVTNNKNGLFNNGENIKRVALVGYEFNNLNIQYGQSKTFVLKDGIQSGYNNDDKSVNVKFETDCYEFNYNVVLLEGRNTTIKLNDCTKPSCECVSFS